MSFRLFGVNVEIQMGFWINTILLGWGATNGFTDLRMLAIWVPIVLVSILVHELGHALAIARHGIEPEISLHWMGGTTAWRQVVPVSRLHRVIISLAGPVAGFLLAGLAYGFMRLFPAVYYGLPSLARTALGLVVLVNVTWGIFNLIPVLPLDGGHVLEHALGPKRARLTAMISLSIAGLGAALFFANGWYFAAFIFAMSAFQSYQRMRSEEPTDDLAGRAPPRPREPIVPGEILAKLRSARRALVDDDYALAARLANDAVKLAAEHEEPLPRVRVEAYELLGWVALHRGDPAEAERWIKAAEQHGPPDAALVAAVLAARGDAKDARRVLEQARAAGDDRKEIVGPLIQILIAEGEVPRAAAVALDIVESLSDEDARKMAQIAFGARAYDWAARLFETVLARTGSADDAYEAARAYAADGAHERALDLLGKAVSAGFSDRARAWSDAALEPLRAGHKLETVVPRP
jgi:Zn-dependent protease